MHQKTLAIIASCIALASCSQDPINPEENKQTQQGTTITIEAMLSEDVQKAMSPRPAAAAWMGNEETEKTTAAFPWELGGCMSVIIRLRRRCISIYSQLTDC